MLQRGRGSFSNSSMPIRIQLSKKPPQFPGEAFYAFVFSSSAAFPSRLRLVQISHETVFEGNEMISWFT